MSRKTGLGRGLDALIQRTDQPELNNISYISVDRILPNPRQPRSQIDTSEITELAASIQEHGVIQPLIVSYDEAKEEYTLIAGERRLIAARQASISRIPVIIRTVNEQERLELALIENIQRSDLNPLEAAEAYRQLAEDFNLSHDEISSRVGKNRTTISNTLRLLKLPETIKQVLAEGKISEGHARALLSLPTSQAQNAVLQVIISRNLSVRQTEDLVRKYSGEKPKSSPASIPDPQIVTIEDKLRQHLGTKVKVNPRRKGGTVVIHYYSEEELNSILEILLNE